ncbi:oxidoreductase [Sphingomonas sp. Root710]|uniref:oxidoreductase n=1 Tax=Sphingomonas sp. Root710 TaxID=1736594 RepID=UPI0006F952D1|nr:oxidoreductase [Sphingomonas sp. Root710]KRB85478.1 oxidoreductase [Sphingomonas sp. Root710]
MTIESAGTYTLGDRTVRRIGYGAMQLAGANVWGPPADRAGAVALLREAVALGINHIDTCDYYGPHVVNEIIREALAPYPEDLTIVTKIGFFRGENGSWDEAYSDADLEKAVHDNLRNLGKDVIDVVNLRLLGDGEVRPAEASIEREWTVLARLREQGLVRHLGISNATMAQVREAQAIAPVVCVQNMYNLRMRADDAMIDELAAEGIAFTPFFPLGGFSPLQSSILSDVAAELGHTPVQVALAWLLRRSPNILLIPGSPRIDWVGENLLAGDVDLTPAALEKLDGIAAAETV